MFKAVQNITEPPPCLTVGRWPYLWRLLSGNKLQFDLLKMRRANSFLSSRSFLSSLVRLREGHLRSKNYGRWPLILTYLDLGLDLQSLWKSVVTVCIICLFNLSSCCCSRPSDTGSPKSEPQSEPQSETQLEPLTEASQHKLYSCFFMVILVSLIFLSLTEG